MYINLMYIFYYFYHMYTLHTHICIYTYVYMGIRKEKCNKTRFSKYIQNSASVPLYFRLQTHRG